MHGFRGYGFGKVGIIFKLKILRAARRTFTLLPMKNREWATLIKIINIISEAIKPFFINKGVYVFFDLIEIMIKLGVTFAVTHNG
jgi:hypothetical protein